MTEHPRIYLIPLLLLSVSLAVAQPRLKFSEMIADAGTLSVGKEESRTVHLLCKNIGTQPLIFKSVEASCPCADIRLPKKPLKPGKETKIKVTFHAKDLDDRGVVTNLLTFFYNGPNKFTRIRLRAELTD